MTQAYQSESSKNIEETYGDAPLFKWVINNGVKQPVRCSIGLHKVSGDGMTRYFRVYIEGHDVTTMAAKAIGLTVSKAKDSYGCVIIHGCGSDMALEIQHRLYRAAFEKYGDMFDINSYDYIGRYNRGKYILNMSSRINIFS